ncbi:MAG: hypothetical protein ACPL5I_09340 [Thermodesulfobacteriota bacterium]
MHLASFFLGLAFISFATLLLEISLTRLFSVAQGYHFAFLVVSMALLGYGASGSFLFSFPKFLRQHPEKKLVWSSWLFSLSTPLAYILSNLLPFDLARLYLDPGQIFYIFIYYLLWTTPFFFSGLTISSALAIRTHLAGKIYFADLGGAGGGCLSALILFDLWGGPGTLIFSAWGGFFAFLLFARLQKGRPKIQFLKWAWGSILFVFLFWPPSFLDLRLSNYKPLQAALLHPGAHLLETHWNVLGRIDILESPAMRTAPGLSLLFLDSLPPQIGLAIDAERLSAITKMNNRETIHREMAFIEFLPASFPYLLISPENVLILEPRGGLEVLTALYYGAQRITVVEINPLLVSLLKGKYRSFSGGIYDHPHVNVAIDDLRNYVRRNPGPFDLIVLSLAESWPASTSGISSLHEDYRLTTEAMSDYIKVLSPNGALALSLYLNPPPRAELRLVAMIKEALKKMGKDPQQHLLIFRTWGTFNLLVKKNPLLPREAQALDLFCEKLRFDLVYYPGITPEKANIYNRFPTPIYFQSVQKILRGEENFLQTYPFDLTPPTDEKPFFHHYFRWAYLGKLYQVAGQKWQIFMEGGYLVPFVFLVSLILSSIFIIFPLLYRWPHRHIDADQQKYKIPCLIYFAGLGLGFMAAEISLIQKFILFLGHPVYSVSLVLFSMLIFAGLGSRVSQKINLSALRFNFFIFLMIISFFLFYAFFLTDILALGQGLPLGGRQIFTVFLTGLLAFFMGMPFPLGMRLWAEKAPDLVPLAWSVNGCTSVLGAIFPIIIALAWGFPKVFLVAAFLYGLSYLAFREIQLQKK